MNLSKQIAHYRKNQNISQEALAKLLGISNQAVSKWETGQNYPDVELLPKLADIFGITLDELFGRKTLNTETSTLSVTSSDNMEHAISALPENAVALSWPDDETLRVVLFQGHHLVQADELKERFGKISKNVVFTYYGPALNIESSLSIICEDVAGNVTAGSYVECDNVGQGVIAGSYVECDNVGQNVIAGSYIECDDVGQNATAGSYIECEDVGNNASAGSNIDCGDVGCNVNAGGDVDCGDVNGDVTAEGNVDCGDVTGCMNTRK